MARLEPCSNCQMGMHQKCESQDQGAKTHNQRVETKRHGVNKAARLRGGSVCNCKHSEADDKTHNIVRRAKERVKKEV